MSNERSAVTQVLQAIRQGDPGAAERLYEMVYAELRQMARGNAARESEDPPSPTSIVHEAYLRLVGNADTFDNRAHFFGAAAEAMRRVLVDRARQRHALKRGGEAQQVSLNDTAAVEGVPPIEVLDVSVALDKLEALDVDAATVVKLRYFAGMTVTETAEALDMSPRTVNRHWTMARAWLMRAMREDR